MGISITMQDVVKQLGWATTFSIRIKTWMMRLGWWRDGVLFSDILANIFTPHDNPLHNESCQSSCGVTMWTVSIHGTGDRTVVNRYLIMNSCINTININYVKMQQWAQKNVLISNELNNGKIDSLITHFHCTNLKVNCKRQNMRYEQRVSIYV